MRINEVTLVSSLMDTINKAEDGADGHSAFFALADCKQDLIDNEDYEILVDLHRLEQLHEVAIPFKLKGD